MRDPMDDPRLTAYVLGELDEAGRSAVEALLATSEEARREVAEIEKTTSLLREALATQSASLTDDQRASIEVAAADSPTKDVPSTPRRAPTHWLFWTLATAGSAGMLVALSVPSLLRARVAVPRMADYSLPGPAVTRAPMVLEQEHVATAHNTEAYDYVDETPFVLVSHDPRSTFGADVDTASYANVRRFLSMGQLPPKDAVRVEELVNYFPYAYEPPHDGRPFAVHMDAAVCPWKPEHRLVRIAIKGRELPRGQRPPANLVFLLDVSGSMNEPNKLPLVQAAMRLLVDNLDEQDRVAIVVYAGAEGLALPSTSARERGAILSAIDSLRAGGSTHASAGIRLAYEIAQESFIQGGVNRVILATDGDFNVGVTSQGELVRMIEEKAKSRVFLTALGFGMGNYKDATLQKLADRGNGNYAYIDTLNEARKVLVEQASGTLVTIAKDVKLQVEFNPRKVNAFRLIGYEKRALRHQDFNDDKKDAGEIGAGHTVTALYEIVPAGVDVSVSGVDPLKYQQAPRTTSEAGSGEMLTLKLRYKEPEGDRSTLMEVSLRDGAVAFAEAPVDFRFAASVAAFGMTLRQSPNRGDADFDKVLAWARPAVGQDTGNLRSEFLTLAENARALSRNR